MSETAEQQLAQFVERLEPAALPAEVLERVRDHVLDAIACGLAGVQAEHSWEVRGFSETVFGAGSSTVLGGAALSPAGAAFVNGFQIAAPTLGDVHRPTLTHVMPEVFPAVLAAAEVHGASGKGLLAGVAAGMEVTIRVADALDTDEYRLRAFHNPGIAGAVGAACAAARVMRLDQQQLSVAMGHAASQAGGTFAALGTSGVKAHQARGGLSGLLGAQLAAAGVDASKQALTTERGGLLASYAGGGLPERLTDGLGTDWRLMDVSLRRWPGASSLQPVIEATLLLQEAAVRYDDQAEDFHKARVELPPRAYALNGTPGWESRLAALQSARWTVAVAVTDGDLWLEQTSDERRLDEAVAMFARERVYVTEDASLSPAGARVTAITPAGYEHTEVIDVPCGDPRRPLTRAEVIGKLHRAASGVGLEDRVDGIVGAVESLESAESVDRLTSLLEVG